MAPTMRRVLWVVALVLIGDGVVAAVMPRRHMLRWYDGPDWYQRAMRPLVDHAAATRAVGLGKAGLAMWWSHSMRDRPG